MAVLRFLAVAVVVFFLFRFVDFAIYKSSHRFAINPMKNRSWIGKFITKVIKLRWKALWVYKKKEMTGFVWDYLFFWPSK